MRPLLTTIALTAAVLAGCHQAPPLGVLDPASGTLAAAAAYPAISGAIDEGTETTQIFRIDTGDDAGAEAARAVRPGKEVGTCVVSWTVGGEDSPRHESVVRREGGSLLVVRMPNRERDVVTIFEPALVHLPESLDPSSPAEQSLTMLIADFDSPDRVTRRGDAQSTITLVGSEELLVEGRPTQAAVVRTELVSTFGPAQVNRVTDRWFVRGEGLVGERYDETVRIFNVVSEQREQTAWRRGVEPINDEDASSDAG